jgi:hypothetical protein
MKIEIKKITERIKNIIELKCNIDLDWKYALKRTNHARVYETSFVHKPSHVVYACSQTSCTGEITFLYRQFYIIFKYCQIPLRIKKNIFISFLKTLNILIPITLLDMTTITVIDHGMSLSVL